MEGRKIARRSTLTHDWRYRVCVYIYRPLYRPLFETLRNNETLFPSGSLSLFLSNRKKQPVYPRLRRLIFFDFHELWRNFESLCGHNGRCNWFVDIYICFLAEKFLERFRGEDGKMVLSWSNSRLIKRIIHKIALLYLITMCVSRREEERKEEKVASSWDY